MGRAFVVSLRVSNTTPTILFPACSFCRPTETRGEMTGEWEREREEGGGENLDKYSALVEFQRLGQ